MFVNLQKSRPLATHWTTGIPFLVGEGNFVFPIGSKLVPEPKLSPTKRVELDYNVMAFAQMSIFMFGRNDKSICSYSGYEV